MAHPDARREEVLALLKANGGNVKRTAREAGVPVQTVADWKKKAPVLGTESRSQNEATLEELFEHIIRVAAGLLPGKLETAKPSETGTVLGIVFDKLQLLRGAPTQITEDVSHERTALHGRLGQLASRSGTGVVPGGANGKASECSEL